MEDAFTHSQRNSLKDFLEKSRSLIQQHRVPPAYLLYLLARIPDDNQQNMYTKVNKVLLRDTLNKRKRLYLDFLVKNA